MPNLIPYVRQMAFAYVLIQGWIVYPYEQWFFLSICRSSGLPPHYTEIFHGNIVTSGIIVVMDGGRCLEVFFEPLSKCSRGLCNVFLITLHPITFVSLYDSTFFWMYLDLLEPLGGF